MLAMAVNAQSSGQSIEGSSAAANPQIGEARWVPTGDLKEARYSHTATLLHEGKVLVVGGYGEKGGLDTAELYDPTTETWSATGRMSVAKSGHSATLLQDGRVLVVGWANDANSAEIYDPSTGNWTVTSAATGPWQDQTATLLQSGKVLLAGGWPFGSLPWRLSSGGSASFDPVPGSWSPTDGDLVPVGEGHRATLLRDGRVLVTGGSTDADFGFGVRDTYLYDALGNTWSRGHDLRVPRLSHSATLLPDGRVLVAGGDTMLAEDFWRNPSQSRPPPQNTAELFDPALGIWNSTGDLNVGHYGHTASLLPSGEVLVAGGWTFTPPKSYGLAKQTELYEARDGRWRRANDLNAARRDHTATLLPNGKVLVAGGFGDAGILKSAEIYGPSPGTIVSAFTGSWYDPAQSGQGLFIEVLPDNRFFAGWFTFNPAGTEQSWFVGVGTYSGNTATITAVDQPMGGRWIPNFDPARVTHNAWGRLTFTFYDCSHGRVDFNSTAGYGSGSMNLTRLTQPAGLACP
jgi:N-acetylneuraminic acid mutarotase